MDEFRSSRTCAFEKIRVWHGRHRDLTLRMDEFIGRLGSKSSIITTNKFCFEAVFDSVKFRFSCCRCCLNNVARGACHLGGSCEPGAARRGDGRVSQYIYMLMIHVNYLVIRRIDYFVNFH